MLSDNRLYWCHSVANLHFGQCRRWKKGSISSSTASVIIYLQTLQRCYKSVMLDQWSAYEAWCLHYPQCTLATKWHHLRILITLHATECNNWRQFIRWHAASSPSPVHTLICKIGEVTLSCAERLSLSLSLSLALSLSLSLYLSSV